MQYLKVIRSIEVTQLSNGHVLPTLVLHLLLDLQFEFPRLGKLLEMVLGMELVPVLVLVLGRVWAVVLVLVSDLGSVLWLDSESVLWLGIV